MKVHGIEGMSPDQIVFEIDRGGKFVFYRYCISVLILTFRRSSDIYFIPSGVRGEQGTAVDYGNRRTGLVGNSVGSHLERAVAGDQFSRRRRCDGIYLCPVPGWRRSSTSDRA